jgi:hypothetical protein
VHAHGLRAGALSVLAPRPVVVTLHNEVSGRVAAVLERLVAHRARVVLAASADLARGRGRSAARTSGWRRWPRRRWCPPGRDPGLGHPLVLAVGGCTRRRATTRCWRRCGLAGGGGGRGR